MSFQASKRPLDLTTGFDNAESKRMKLDQNQNDTHGVDDADASVMDMDLDLDAMVQDVLGDIDNQMSKFTALDATLSHADMDHTEPPTTMPSQEPPEPFVTFSIDPKRSMQRASLPALVNFVSHRVPSCSCGEEC